VDILSSGDTVSELFLLLSGTAEVISPDPSASARHASQLAPQGDSLAAALADAVSDAEGEIYEQTGNRGSSVSGEDARPVWSAASGEARLSPNSPISADLAGMRSPVSEGTVLVGGEVWGVGVGVWGMACGVERAEAGAGTVVCFVVVEGRGRARQVGLSYCAAAAAMGVCWAE
jgi:hypothetical protein